MADGNEVMVVGSVALDTVITPFGEARDMLGGSAVYFSIAASLYAPVRFVGVVGDDFPQSAIDLLELRGIDLAGLQHMQGRTFRWGGRYGYDLNQRDTLFTELNVFEQFRPDIPEAYRKTPYAFLGNIDPVLQNVVLKQIDNPTMVAGDTMNFWIEGKRQELMDVVAALDVLMLNDAEVRQMANEPNLLRAANHVLQRGPKCVVVKKGEHGAMMVMEDGCFFAPAFPLDSVLDPTGAGDSFAGGFMGYLARCQSPGEAEIRGAIVHGSVVASFCVEDFGVNRLATLTMEEIEERVVAFQRLTSFDLCPNPEESDG